MSSIDLFLSRDCGGGAGPDVELARRVGPVPVPVPAPAPAALVLVVPNAEALGAEEVPTLGSFLAGPEVAVAVVDAEDVVTLAFAKRLKPELADVVGVPDDAAVVAAGDGAWLAPILEDPKAGNRLALKGGLADTGSADGCDVLIAASGCDLSCMSVALLKA